MFVFDNLLEMDDKNLGTLIRNIDGDILITRAEGRRRGGRATASSAACRRAPPTASATRWRRAGR